MIKVENKDQAQRLEAMLKSFIVNIKGKNYVTVAGRVVEAHFTSQEGLSIETELVDVNENWVLFKAKVTIGDNIYTGYATSTFSKGGMEEKSPVEVAETSSVGRALGFAGFGIVEGIATAEEVTEAEDRGAFSYKDASDNYKTLFSKVVSAQTIKDINDVMTADTFKVLTVEEQLSLRNRIGKQVKMMRTE